MYRANVDVVNAYFARRTADPQLVADLTADTFVAVITHFRSFAPRKGTAPAWGRAGGHRGTSAEGGGGGARAHAGHGADAADADPRPAAQASRTRVTGLRGCRDQTAHSNRQHNHEPDQELQE